MNIKEGTALREQEIANVSIQNFLNFYQRQIFTVSHFDGWVYSSSRCLWELGNTNQVG